MVRCNRAGRSAWDLTKNSLDPSYSAERPWADGQWEEIDHLGDMGTHEMGAEIPAAFFLDQQP